MHEREELELARIAEVPVEAVVLVEGADEVFRVHRAAEELEAVVERVVDHDVLDDGLVADAGEREAVDLVVHGELDAAELDADIPEDAGVVVGLGAAILGVGGHRDALHGGLAADHVDRRAAEDDETTPVACGAAAGGLLAREDDRRVGLAVGDDLRAGLHHEGALGALIAEERGAGLDGELGGRIDIDDALDDPALVGRDGQVGADLRGELLGRTAGALRRGAGHRSAARAAAAGGARGAAATIRIRVGAGGVRGAAAPVRVGAGGAAAPRVTAGALTRRKPESAAEQANDQEGRYRRSHG